MTHIKPALKYVKEKTKWEVNDWNQVRSAGTDGFLSGLFGPRKTHSKDFNVGVKNQNNHAKNDGQHISDPEVFAGWDVGAWQLNDGEAVTVNLVDEVPTQLRVNAGKDPQNRFNKREQPGQSDEL